MPLSSNGPPLSPVLQEQFQITFLRKIYLLGIMNKICGHFLYSDGNGGSNMSCWPKGINIYPVHTKCYWFIIFVLSKHSLKPFALSMT